MHFYKVPYRRRCQEYDGYNTGELTITEFSTAINHEFYKLSLNQIEDIVKLAPLSVDKKVKYSSFFIFLLKIGKPQTLYSVPNMLEFRKSELFEDDYHTIVTDDYFKLKARFNLRNFKLFKMKVGTAESYLNDIDEFNNKIYLENFLANFAAECFKKIRSAYY